ncbi:hypothetical protein A9Q83_14530 [Alphaproteobacteria bacterium 46_93_T64]|nr:hypothetical protein A9Q83_14530 [Alphaproteobacteria bacterium 46_93_T64]
MSVKREPVINLSSLGGGRDRKIHEDNLDDFDAIRFRRLCAYAIDVVCIFFIGIAATIVATLMGIVSLGLLSPILAVGLMLVPLAYHTVTIGSELNATIGMRFMGLEVYLYSGDEPDYLTALIHSGLFYFSMAVTSSLILLLSLFNSKGRLLHDYLTNSGVRLAKQSKEDL